MVRRGTSTRKKAVGHLDWVIAGSESGPRSRPAELAWFRSIRDQCRAAGVSFFQKQLTESGRQKFADQGLPASSRHEDGRQTCACATRRTLQPEGMLPMTETYQSPAHGWTCFHCGETFMHPNPARNHFGATPDAEPGCVLRLQGADHGLLRKVRGLENQIARYREEDTDLHRKVAAMASDHAAALRSEEEKGYARGLRDAWAPLRDLRAAGWSVAVHNDYWVDGRSYTFWLLTHPSGRWIKGEGETDLEALEQCSASAR
jgi:hypothetical protein